MSIMPLPALHPTAEDAVLSRAILRQELAKRGSTWKIVAVLGDIAFQDRDDLVIQVCHFLPIHWYPNTFAG